MKIPNETHQREKLLTLLREIRGKKSILQVEVAEYLGVPQSVISKYESGVRRLDVLELRQVCQAMGISLQDFVKLLEEKLNETK